MALIKLKNTVIVPRVVVIACAAVNAANLLGLPDLLITSGNDSKHMKGSRHYKDEALDFRTKHMTEGQKHAFRAELKKRLGSTYDVILEDEGAANEHLHAEYNGK